MEEISIIGVDIAKHVFQVHGARADGSVAFSKKLSRASCFRFWHYGRDAWWRWKLVRAPITEDGRSRPWGIRYPSSQSQGPIVPRPREGHRRRFDETDKHRILEEAVQPGASVSEVARRYGIDRRLLCRWKQELTPPAFVAVDITDAETVACRRCSLRT